MGIHFKSLALRESLLVLRGGSDCGRRLGRRAAARNRQRELPKKCRNLRTIPPEALLTPGWLVPRVPIAPSTERE